MARKTSIIRRRIFTSKGREVLISLSTTASTIILGSSTVFKRETKRLNIYFEIEKSALTTNPLA